MIRILIGFLICATLLALIIGAIFVYPKLLSQKNSSDTGKETFSLTLSTLEDEEYTTHSIIKIVGKTSAGAIVIAYSNTAEEVTQARSDGLFSINFPLTSGLNEISILAQNESGEEKVESRDIFSDTAGVIEATQSAKPKDSESTVAALAELRQRIEKERNRQKIRVYAGSVKAILDQNLAISTKKGSRTARLSSNSKIVINGKTGSFKEIQVEDYLVAVGRLDNSGISVLNLNVLDQKPEMSRLGVFGIVSQVDEKGMILIKQISGDEKKITFDSQTKIIAQDGEKSITELEIGKRVAVVGSTSKDGISARKVFITEGDFKGILEKFGKTATSSAHPPAGGATSSATQSAR